MKIINNIFIAIIVLMQLSSVTAEAKVIGVVDIQRTLNESEAGKDAKLQLASRVKKYQDEINVRQDVLKKMKNELEKQGMLLSDSARSAKEKDYQNKLEDFKRFAKDAQDDLQAKDEKLTKIILDSFYKTIKSELADRYLSICPISDGKIDCADGLIAGFKTTNLDNVPNEDITQLVLKLVNNKSVPELKAAFREKSPPAQKPYQNTVVETQSPIITITSPDVGRSLKVAEKGAIVTIKGVAASKYGISEVLINDSDAVIDAQGNFAAETRLKVGENVITVSAVDTKNMRTEKTFTIVRELDSKSVSNNIVSPNKQTNPVFGKYYALLIAVQDYASPEINKLDHPINDATKIKNILTKTYTFDDSRVILLKNPDRKAIGKAFNDLRSKLTENDNLLVFYAGHGIWLEDMKQGYWLPKDASGANDPTDWIPNSTIRDNVRAIRAKHILLIADACFSGGIFKVRDAFMRPDVSVEKTYEMPSRKAITSGSLKTVPDRSVFIEYLTKRLKDNKEKYLDSQKLFVSFKDAVINNSPVNQTPLYGAINEAGDEGGDFIFVHR